MPNLLILRTPDEDNTPVTAEVASSSLVVPAILSKSRPELFFSTHVMLRCVREWSSEAGFRRKPQRERCRLDVLGPSFV